MATVGTLLEFLYLGETKMTEMSSENLHTLCQMLDINIGEDKITIQDVFLPEQFSPVETVQKSPPLQASEKRQHKEAESTSKSAITLKPSTSSKSSSKALPSGTKTSKKEKLYCYCKKPTSKDLIG